MKRILLLISLLASMLFAQGENMGLLYNPNPWTKTSSFLYHNSGQVGIGSTTAKSTEMLNIGDNLAGTKPGSILFSGTTYAGKSIGSVSTLFFIGDADSNSGTGSGDIAFLSDGYQRENLRITDIGNIGIGTSAPANKVRIVGGMYADTVLYTTLVNLSDTTLKHDIQRIGWDLSQFKDVHPIKYKYTPDCFYYMDDSTRQAMSELEHTGFSAQEFNGKIVGTNEKQVDLMQVTVALWLKVQELETRIKALENK